MCINGPMIPAIPLSVWMKRPDNSSKKHANLSLVLKDARNATTMRMRGAGFLRIYGKRAVGREKGDKGDGTENEIRLGTVHPGAYEPLRNS